MWTCVSQLFNDHNGHNDHNGPYIKPKATEIPRPQKKIPKIFMRMEVIILFHFSLVYHATLLVLRTLPEYCNDVM